MLSETRSKLKKMSRLEQLRPLFRLCQFTGMLPFRLESEGKLARLDNFTYSWKYPITWYFITTTIISVAIYAYFVCILFNSEEFYNLPLVIKTTTETVALLYISLILSSRFWLAFKLSTLRKAIELMQKIESNQQTNANRIDSNNSTIKVRFILGAVIIFVWVYLLHKINSILISISFNFIVLYFLQIRTMKCGGILLGATRILYAISFEHVGIVGTILLLGLACQSLASLGSGLLFIHLIYYQMSHSIHILRCQINDYSKEK